MSPFVRKVPTASGATAVQIADKTGGQYRIVEHLGSARTPEDLAALIEAGKAKLRDPGQATLDFDTADKPRVASAVVKSSRSGLLIDTIRTVYGSGSTSSTMKHSSNSSLPDWLSRRRYQARQGHGDRLLSKWVQPAVPAQAGRRRSH